MGSRMTAAASPVSAVATSSTAPKRQKTVSGTVSLCWRSKGGKPVTRQRGRFNWYGRDPEWKDQLGFRGREDVEKPVGEWNVQEVIAAGDTLTNIVNGVVVNRATGAKPSQGKLQIQSEGAEIWIRKVELRPIK